MKHIDEQQLLQLIEDTLPEAKKEECLIHLRTCDVCRENLASLIHFEKQMRSFLKAEREKCPDPMEIWELDQGLLETKRAEEIRQHLSYCSICAIEQELASEFAEMIEEQEEQERQSKLKVGESKEHPFNEVFISYASRDRDQVLEIVRLLESAGVSVGLERGRNDVEDSYEPGTIAKIRNCKALMLMCSEASMRSRKVKHDIQIAWKYERRIIPILLEAIPHFPEQIEYWLTERQWIEVKDYPPKVFMSSIIKSLSEIGAQHSYTDEGIHVPGKLKRPPLTVVSPTKPKMSLEGLRSLAGFTDQIWPVHGDQVHAGVRSGSVRGMGAPQAGAQHRFRLGDGVCIVIESDRDGYLLLLDEGPEGIIYCLCPSLFAPDTHIYPGKIYLPHKDSSYSSFMLTGEPGREELLAIISDVPLGMNWMPNKSNIPATILTATDISDLVAKLRELEEDSWMALSTYLDILS